MNNMDVKIGMKDALNLIPEFNGEEEDNNIKFVYFREGCRNALKVLGDKNEELLLMFLKNKLKGNAYTRFALKLTTYAKLSQFIRDIKEVYASRCDIPTLWSLKMMELKQKENESTLAFGAQFQELLQCAIFGIKYGELKNNPFTSKDPKDKQIEDMDGVAATHFVTNLSNARVRSAVSVRRPFKSLMEIMNVSASLEESYNESNACKICYESDHSESECCLEEGYKYMYALDHECNICEEKGHLDEDCPTFEKYEKQAAEEERRESLNRSNNQGHNSNGHKNNQGHRNGRYSRGNRRK